MRRETIPAALLEAAERFGDAEAVVDGQVRLTFRELHERAMAVAYGLHTSGITRGDRVAIFAPNTHYWVTSALGVLYAGAALVPINTRFTVAETLDVINRSGARGLFIEGDFLGIDREAELLEADVTLASRVRMFRMPLDWPEAEFSSPAEPDDVADILYTSGTTGRSKGAMSAHRQSLAVARAWVSRTSLGSADRYLVVNPFFHSFGYKAGILAGLVSGAALVPQAVFNAAETIRLVQQEKITVLPGAPTIYQSIMDHAASVSDLPRLRLAVTGAAVVPVALVERMQQQLCDTVLTGYGLTECPVVTLCSPSDSATTVANTSGHAAAGCEVQIAPSGEILVRGPNVMIGYLDDPAATQAAIDSGGWLHTGDIGNLDEDGNLTITDRLKDMYISGGFSVYPAEVEQALARLPGVADSAVVGVPDTRLGEVGKAYIVRQSGAELSEQDVIGFCRTRVANFKVPRFVEFLPELPRNPSGKVLKRVLRGES
ncbi:acyl-CoA synthetase (AMP-forming)/AMP-acid ligase II [Kibdelosporangium banguiense]|uniref:Acyl-CoA synthetase (AMP-forming)/AMP-acid ligase II n=1 Tax=Kibdelosporangium banguiense TaxID=1365924 RepID=A0ABS4TIH5_9PSEU|nr:FadD3 family acyl-CoA ligase [Kibdelosporangium banguiense]MBP2324228.1 acyl-CoA synthetase (AMP-forming)/AMP-acid ligase II [Kibdelosporangium banguiense]